MQTKNTKKNPLEKNMRHPTTSVVFSLILMSLFLAGVSAFTEYHPKFSHDRDPKHFVLVHGACLGAWSWYKLIPALRSYGHNVTAIDLAASGINLVRVNDIRTFSDYSKPLIDFMESISENEKVILVGHSLGGASISQALELFPEKVSVGVFLTAAMPGPSLPFSEIFQKGLSTLGSALDNKLSFDDGPNNPPTTFIFGPNYISQVLFQFSPPQDAALANVLARPLRLTTGEELVFSKEKYGSVNRVFIISEKDMVLSKQFQQFMIDRNTPNRVETIFGSDHMVMVSQPVQLLFHLLGIARDFS